MLYFLLLMLQSIFKWYKNKLSPVLKAVPLTLPSYYADSQFMST